MKNKVNFNESIQSKIVKPTTYWQNFSQLQASSSETQFNFLNACRILLRIHEVLSRSPARYFLLDYALHRLQLLHKWISRQTRMPQTSTPATQAKRTASEKQKGEPFFALRPTFGTPKGQAILARGRCSHLFACIVLYCRILWSMLSSFPQQPPAVFSLLFCICYKAHCKR